MFQMVLGVSEYFRFWEYFGWLCTPLTALESLYRGSNVFCPGWWSNKRYIISLVRQQGIVFALLRQLFCLT